MSNFTPAQQEAIYNLTDNLAVSAGAGAGKTRVLVERYINILDQEQAACDEILAITFTNKAAKEMKERIRSKAVMLADGADTVTERAKWQTVRQQLEYAPISTIHSLCARILRENPVEAVLDPNFGLLDEIEASLLTEAAVKEVLAQGLESGAEWVECLFACYGKKVLTETVLKLYEKLAGQGLFEHDLAAEFAAPYLKGAAGLLTKKAELSSLCEELIAFRPKLSIKSEQYQKVVALEQNWPAVSRAIMMFGGPGHSEADAVLKTYLDVLEARGKDKDIVKKLKAALSGLRLAVADKQAADIIPHLVTYLTAIKARVDALKAARHVLTFNDLELRTAKLLAEHQNVCAKYMERFRYIMVDEFQDTNDLQRQIVYLLAGGHCDRLYGRKLFIVGDPKQSIYRFRGADVAIFERVAQDIVAGGGKLLQLDTNFRSLEGILAVVNECFTPIMSTEFDTISFTALQAHRRLPAAAPCVEFIIIDEKELSDEESGREAEARAIASRIRRMVCEAQPVLDDTGEQRAVSFGDIAILFRATTDLETYEAALQEAAVPYYVLGSSGFYHRQEIMDIVNLLKVIDNCYQETALAGVLRSPLFLLSDETLVHLKAAGDSLWQGLSRRGQCALGPAQMAAADKAWVILNALRQHSNFVKIADLITTALKQTSYQQLVLAQFMGLQKYANIQKLIEIARTFQQKDFYTLSDFVRYVEKLMLEEAKEGEAQIEAETGNTVKLMTIHKSKGLEYPVVFVPDLHRQFHGESGPIVYNAEYGIGLKVRDGDDNLITTSCYQMVSQQEKILTYLEMKRLLYVAFTRAKDYLVLSGVGKQFAEDKHFHELNTWMKWMGKVCQIRPEEQAPAEISLGSATIRVCCQPKIEDAVRQVRVYQSKQAAAMPDELYLSKIMHQIKPIRRQQPDIIKMYSASALARFMACPRSFYYRYLAGVPEIEAAQAGHGVSSAPPQPPAELVGLAVHKFCELFTPEAELDTCWQQAVKQAVPKEWQEAVSASALPLVTAYARSEFYQQLMQYEGRSEWKFVAAFTSEAQDGSKFTYGGSIDRLVFYPDGTVGIVDFKTDNINKAEFDAAVHRYTRQMALYKLAVEAVLKKTVRDVQLYFVRLAQAVQVPLPIATLAGVKKECLEVFGFVEAHREEADYNCCDAACYCCGYKLLCPRQ